MVEMDEEVLEDIGKLLDDCARQFHGFHEMERQKLGQSLSLVEREDAEVHMKLFDRLYRACVNYRDVAQKALTTPVEGR